MFEFLTKFFNLFKPKCHKVRNIENLKKRRRGRPRKVQK